MILKFSYWGNENSPYYLEPYIVKNWRSYEIGTKLVGCQVNGGRPFEVTFKREELQYLIDHPEYIKHLQQALRDDTGPQGQEK